MAKQKKCISPENELRLIATQMEVVRSGIRSLVYFREIEKLDNKDKWFWLSTKNAHLQHFITSWSKCFGSYSEDTHWKKSILVRSAFTKGLFKVLGTDKHKFRLYLKEILTLRNSVFSHSEVQLKNVYIPKMDLALGSYRYFYKKLQERLEMSHILVIDHGPICLDMWIENLEEEAQKIITTAHSATEQLDEF